MKGMYSLKSKFTLIIELMSGSLTQVLQQVPIGQIPERIISYICRQILQGLVYLHGQHRIHRDIKSDNILISQDVSSIAERHKTWRFWLRCSTNSRA